MDDEALRRQTEPETEATAQEDVLADLQALCGTHPRLGVLLAGALRLRDAMYGSATLEADERRLADASVCGPERVALAVRVGERRLLDALIGHFDAGVHESDAPAAAKRQRT